VYNGTTTFMSAYGTDHAAACAHFRSVTCEYD
jgi:hypothetical protein